MMTVKNKKKRRKKHRVFWTFVIIQMVIILAVVGAIIFYYAGGYADKIDAIRDDAASMVKNTSVMDFVPSQKVTIYDAAENVITERKPEREAVYVAYEDIPAIVVSAMISIEDKKFYSHKGVDYVALLRAAKAYLDNEGTITQGASTITMQLAKLMYLKPDKTWEYKLRQMFLAIELEKHYSKKKILEFYFNNIYFSNGYYGIESACHGYFNCELNELSVSQVAFLCAIPNNPSYYDPLNHMDNTITRRDLILKNMYEDGILNEEEYQEALEEKIVLNQVKTTFSFENDYVDTYTYYCATRILMEKEGFPLQDVFHNEEEEEEYKRLYAETYEQTQKKLFSGGYKIYTSFEMDKQKLLQEAVDNGLAEFQDYNENGSYAMQGSAVCIDNATGYVVAMVGGRKQDFNTYTLNRAYQSRRQPGSSIKPLTVYTPAFERDYTPDSIMNDHEIPGGPKNSAGGYVGDVNLRTALSKSINTIAWQLYEELTPEVGLSYLKEMNFAGIVKADYIPATAIGGFTKGASALEMAAGYAAIENDGYYREPTCIVKIVDATENVIYSSEQVEKKVYDQKASRMTTSCMETVMEEGTGKDSKLEGIPCAGKTGTTNDYKDGWFIGYTRYYTTSVWTGYDYPKEVEGLKGATYPAAIWKTFMQKINEGLTPLRFKPYEGPEEEFIEIFYPEQETTEETYDTIH